MEELNEEVVESKKGLTGGSEGKPTILIPCEIESVSKRGVTVAAGTVYDYKQKKFQQDINEELQQLTDDINQNVKRTLSEHSGEIENINEALEENIPYVIVYENQTINIPCDPYGNYVGSEQEIGTVVKLYRGNIQQEIEYDNSIVIESPTDKGFDTEVIEDDGSAIISIPYADISNLDDTTEVNFYIISEGKAYYGKVIFNKVKRGKSAYEEWKDANPEIVNPTIDLFLAELKNTDNIKGPKYAAARPNNPPESDYGTIYFIPILGNPSTQYNIDLLDSNGEWHNLVTRPGDITNYAGIYDVSEDNKTGNTPKSYSNLSETITDIVAKGVGKGGMTIRFIQGTGADAKYVQYRLIRTTFPSTFSADDWQGVDDVATEESNNLVTSDGVAKYLNEALFSTTEVVNDIYTVDGNANCWIDNNGYWYLNHGQKGALITCESDWLGKQLIVQGSSLYASKVAFLKSNTITDGSLADYCSGEANRRSVEVGGTDSYTIPSDCTHIWFAIGTTGSGNENAYRPSKVIVRFDDNGIISQIEDRIDALELSERENTVDIDIDLSECKDENWYYYISGENEYDKTAADETTGNTGVFYPLRCKAKKLYVEGTDILTSKVAFLKSQRGDEPDFCEGETRHTIAKGASETFDIPNDCKYIWFAIGQRGSRTSYNENSYRPKKVTLLDVTLENNKLDVPNDNRTYSVKNDLLNPLNNVFGIFDYIRCESQEAIPVGNDAIGYAEFIDEWDDFTSQHSEFSEKEEIIKSTTGDYSIYKYVYAPTYYEKTIFLTAGMHGNEYEGFWGLLRCMQYILENGNKNDVIGYIRHRCRIIIIPVLNPYGVENGIRYSTNSAVDQNYNFDVAWGKLCNPNTTTKYVIGNEPFEYNEPKAVKLVCDDYEGEILFHIDFHTDPFNANHANNSKCNYIEADEDSIIFPAAYRLTLDEREHIKNDIRYQNPASDFVVWTNKAATSFRYMEWVRHIPSIIVETTTRKSSSDANGFAGESGSAAVMKATVDWYLNCICMMLTNVL